MKSSLLTGAAMLALVMAGCANPEAETAKRAEALLESAQTALDAQNYPATLQLVDSLDRSCKEAVDVRRRAMPLRAKAIEGLTLDSLADINTRLAACMQTIDSLGRSMTVIDDGAGGYSLPSAWPSKNDIMATGIEPRVDRQGFFRLVVKNSDKQLGLNAVSFGEGAGAVSTAALPGDRVARVEGSELMSLSREEFMPVVDWLMSNPAGGTVTLTGTTGTRQLTLTPAMALGLRHAWEFGEAYQQMLTLDHHRAILEKRLKIARDQQATLL